MAADDDDQQQQDERVTVRLPAALVNNVRALAKVNDESLSRIVRRAFRQYLASGKQQLDLEDAIRAAPRKPPKAKPKPARAKPIRGKPRSSR